MSTVPQGMDYEADPSPSETSQWLSGLATLGIPEKAIMTGR